MINNQNHFMLPKFKTSPSLMLPSVLLLSGMLCLLLSGCATSNVKPWQKGTLAMPVMSPQGDASLVALNEHVFTSKEASKGGGGVAGGGCGCN